jgi:hypothetical protein
MRNRFDPDARIGCHTDLARDNDAGSGIADGRHPCTGQGTCQSTGESAGQGYP